MSTRLSLIIVVAAADCGGQTGSMADGGGRGDEVTDNGRRAGRTGDTDGAHASSAREGGYPGGLVPPDGRVADLTPAAMGRCSDPDGVAPQVRGTTRGTNGVFEDQCDSAGNLVEYICEVAGCGNNCTSCGCDPTGQVMWRSIDCDGRCSAGACAARCPDFGDLLTYRKVNVAGEAEFENLADRHSYVYACRLVWDDPKDTYNCARDPVAGLKVKVVTLGLRSDRPFCTAGTFGSIGVADALAPLQSPSRCNYECRSMY